ncbi:DUF2063 domain-containing protein [Pelagibius sp. Alg239-R121]|uniref:HvfC/BufC N-terminal domain-containing protein n=1 Tax=Pelagibius sp. Alg239-R121 TaxID=2993448 RepID=UPI0024A68062|nr:DNA-binding domain-containing protein [Pelagibius sp. Alg239-R121]
MSLSEIQSEFIAGLRDPSAPPPDSLKARGGTLPKRRFDVYRNNVVASLIEALKASFPAVLHLVGDEFFKATARVYIDLEPPRSPLMFLYGKTFGDFLDRFPPAASIPYLGDVARLEWARLSAYHAADRTAISIDSLAEIRPDQLGAVTFQLHPSLELFSSRWPLFSLWAATSGLAPQDAVKMDAPEQVIVVRPAFDVDTRRLPSDGYNFIKALREGATLGEAAGLAAEISQTFDLANHLEGLFQLGAVIGITKNHD